MTMIPDEVVNSLGNLCGDCEPGYKHQCPERHEFDWIITPTRIKPDFGSED